MTSNNHESKCTAHFNTVYDKTFDSLRKFVASKCSDPYYIADILQETYTEYYKVLLRHGIERINNDKAFLIKIAKRRLYAHYSLKEKLCMAVPLTFMSEDGEEYDNPSLPCEESPEEDVISALEAERIWNIIETYPPDVRKILNLYFCEEMSPSEIANATGMKLHTVKNKLYRTIDEIRRKETENE